MYMYMHIYMCICIYNTERYIERQIYMYVYTCTCAYINTYIYLYIFPQTNIFRQVYLLRLGACGLRCENWQRLGVCVEVKVGKRLSA